MSKKRDIWISAGYQLLAEFGPEAITIDRLAAMVEKSRSSFYHLFGDMEVFRDSLCKHHWEQSKQVAMELDNADSFYPDFAHLIAEHKDWCFAHIQIFHNRDKDEKYLQYFKDVTALIEPKIGYLWTKTIGLENLSHSKTVELYRVIREAMFTRMNYKEFSPEILDQQIKELNESLSFLFSETK